MAELGNAVNLPRLMLLPGMDGTGELFAPILSELEPNFCCEVISYSTQEELSYSELINFVRSQFPQTTPWILLAESFSGPVALGALNGFDNPPVALLLCATFVKSPISPLLSRIFSLFSNTIFSKTPPRGVLKTLLLGHDASNELVDQVIHSIKKVSPKVLSHRLNQIFSIDACDWLSKCQSPVFYLQARNDLLVGSRALKTIQSAKEDIKVTSVSGPHLILQTRPKQGAKWILEVVRLAEQSKQR